MSCPQPNLSQFALKEYFRTSQLREYDQTLSIETRDPDKHPRVYCLLLPHPWKYPIQNDSGVGLRILSYSDPQIEILP